MSLQALPPSAAPLIANSMKAAEFAAPTSAATTHTAAPVTPTTAVPPTTEQIQAAVTDVQEALAPVAQNLLFSIDDDTGKTIIKIVDSATDELIRQIPSEEFIAIAKALDNLQGLLLKQKA